MSKGVSFKKFTDDIPNEDSFSCGPHFIAISDGAGGCGLFADKWSRYLVDNLDPKTPISSYEELDEWVGQIWERFFNRYETEAKKNDGIFQSKFYAEGSCATLAAAWLVDKHICKWMAYGDSVIFHFNRKTQELEHSFTKLKDFSNPPFLISCKDPIPREGFRNGTFAITPESVVFACSDALSHFVLMMYMICHKDIFSDEIKSIEKGHSSDSSMLGVAMSWKEPNFNDFITLLEQVVQSQSDFERFMRELNSFGLIDIDDYTLVVL